MTFFHNFLFAQNIYLKYSLLYTLMSKIFVKKFVLNIEHL